MLFFQLMLLVGYGYAHLVVKFLTPRFQGMMHILLLAASLSLIPITPSEAWKTASTANATWRILALLTLTIGGPYVILSTTAPLLQSWFARVHPGKSPFRLYAVSNCGALLALFTFPFVYEPLMTLHHQILIWSGTYVVFAVVCGLCARGLLAQPADELGERSSSSDFQSQAIPIDQRLPQGADVPMDQPPTIIDVLMWLGLAACGSVMLLATTNQMCQDVASVPFLWILPLGIYLLTFIICFDRETWYKRSAFTFSLIVGVFMGSFLLFQSIALPITWQVVGYTYVLFTCCMSCHGELVRSKPHPRHLTLFYMMVSAGGALGGVFVTLIAPVLFDSIWEYQAGLAGCCLLILIIRRRERWRAQEGTSTPLRELRSIVIWAMTVMAGVLTLGWIVSTLVTPEDQKIIAKHRNFYGALQVKLENSNDPERERMVISHGTTVHGNQFQATERRRWPTMYYVEKSGIGVAIQNYPRTNSAQSNLKLGVIGLGAGTLATYGENGDSITFYEINPAMIELAEEHFSYLEDARQRGVTINMQLGDARIVMEQQTRTHATEKFDILAVDAFTSDSIPIHLLTKECFDIYWDHLQPEGVLAVHISNRFLDLSPVVRKLSELSERDALLVRYQPSKEAVHDLHESSWILSTNNRRFLSHEGVRQTVTPWSSADRQPILWTDDFCNLFNVLR